MLDPKPNLFATLNSSAAAILWPLSRCLKVLAVKIAATEINRQRIRMLEKKHKSMLSDSEAAELASLTSQFSAYLKHVAPRSREILNEFADQLAAMKVKLKAQGSNMIGDPTHDQRSALDKLEDFLTSDDDPAETKEDVINEIESYGVDTSAFFSRVRETVERCYQEEIGRAKSF